MASPSDVTARDAPQPVSPGPQPDDQSQAPSCDNSTDAGEKTICEIPSECITLVRTKSGCRHYVPARQTKLRNSLLLGAGFLELANAGDFAANIWNEVPVPVYAIVCMAIGATFTLLMSVVAYRDARLSIINVHLLRMERRVLRALYSHHRHDPHVLRYLDARLDVNFREFGTEIVDRVGMDILMGVGSVVVGVGTYMAIGGANPLVYRISNLLSGYVGNTPAAVYGSINAAWSLYALCWAYRNRVAAEREFRGPGNDNGMLLPALKRRVRIVQQHALLNGATGVVGGVASIITATQWWGYCMLAPCILASIYINYVWRHDVGYDRPVLVDNTSVMEKVDKASLVEQLNFVLLAQKTLAQPPPGGSLQRLYVPQPASLPSVVAFLQRNYLFQDFCLLVLSDTELSELIFGTPLPDELTIDANTFLSLGDPHSFRLLEVARSCVDDVGPSRFQDRERYLLDTLGSYLRSPEVDTRVGGNGDGEEKISIIV